MTHKHICNYIYLFPPFGYLQTFISAYFQKHEILCFFIFSFLKVRTGQGFFHAKVCIMRTKREPGHLERSLLLWALFPVRPSRTHGSWSSSFLGFHCLGLAPLLKTSLFLLSPQSMGSQRVRHDWATEQLPPRFSLFHAWTTDTVSLQLNWLSASVFYLARWSCLAELFHTYIKQSRVAGKQYMRKIR